MVDMVNMVIQTLTSVFGPDEVYSKSDDIRLNRTNRLNRLKSDLKAMGIHFSIEFLNSGVIRLYYFSLGLRVDFIPVKREREYKKGILSFS